LVALYVVSAAGVIGSLSGVVAVFYGSALGEDVEAEVAVSFGPLSLCVKWVGIGRRAVLILEGGVVLAGAAIWQLSGWREWSGGDGWLVGDARGCQLLVSTECLVDGVGESTLEAAQGFGAGLALGALLVHVGLGFGIPGGLVRAITWMARFRRRFPPRLRR
jgi:hypothetical protein